MSITSWIIIIVIALAVIALVVTLVKSRAASVEYDNNEVYVGNLPYRVNEYELKQHFAKFGPISQARIVKNTKTGRSKGFAFVRYPSTKEAKKALAAHGTNLKGRTLVVRIAKSREDE